MRNANKLQDKLRIGALNHLVSTSHVEPLAHGQSILSRDFKTLLQMHIHIFRTMYAPMHSVSDFPFHFCETCKTIQS